MGACSGETSAHEGGRTAPEQEQVSTQTTSADAEARLGTLREELADVQARLEQEGEEAQQALREQADELKTRLDALGQQVEQWKQAGEDAAGGLAGDVGDGLEQLASELKALDEQLSSDG
jgi:chromosome segregation ATPase